MGTDRRKAKSESNKTKGESAKSKKDASRDAKATPVTAHGRPGASEYEWHVKLAAKGMAERDNYPMPPSVTTPDGFYEIMAEAALEATGLRALLGRAARAERELDLLQDALRHADSETAMARHRTSLVDQRSRAAHAAPRVVPPPERQVSVPAPAATAPTPPATAPAPAEPSPGRWAITVGAARRTVGAARRTTGTAAHGAWIWNKRVVFRRPERVACLQCGARHPAIYGGDPCVFCETTLPHASGVSEDAVTPPLSVA